MGFLAWAIFVIILIFLIRMAFPGKESAAVPAERQVPKEEKSEAVGDGRWVPADEEVEIQGIKIPGGMFYLGRHLEPIGGLRSNEPALINPKAQLSHTSIDYDGLGFSYWPSYSDIPPESRRAFITWLATGRRDPRFAVGYVFIFFYGLERRLLADRERVTESDVARIIAEVEELRRIYAKSKSFRGYASEFLDTIRALYLGEGLGLSDEAPGSIFDPIGTRHDEDRTCRVAFAYKAREKKAISASWALADFVTAAADLDLVVKSGWAEFRELFFVRFKERFANGVTLNPTGSDTCEITYHPASAGFGGPISFRFKNLTDAGTASELADIRSVGKECESALGPYVHESEGFSNTKDRPELVALLPQELIHLKELPRTSKIVTWLEEQVASHEFALVKTSGLCEILGTRHEEAGKATSVMVSKFLSRFGFGMEPDARFGGGTLKAEDNLVVFRIPKEAPEAPSDPFLFGRVISQLAAMVAMGDGEIDRTEEEALRKHLKTSLGLSEAECSRLHFLVHFLSSRKTTTVGLKRRLETLSKKERAAIADLLTALALADGKVVPGEVRALQKLYRVLDVPDTVFSALHEAGFAKAAEEPVPVHFSAADKQTEYKIPQSARSTSVSAGFRLSEDEIQKKMADSLSVKALLNSIFTEEETEPESFPLKKDLAGAIGHLDLHHSALLSALGEQGKWAVREFEQMAADAGLLPNGATDRINEEALDLASDVVLESDGEFVTVNQPVLKEMMQCPK